MARKRALQGVNLGGWFVPEKWLTPSLFKDSTAEDLYGLLATKEGQKRYREHLRTFITEADFRWLARYGVEIIRLPVGYWVLAADSPYPTTADQLDWAMRMAEKYHLKVLLDLHSVKGSQNGEMHSGRRGKVEWTKYQHETIGVLVSLAKKYKDNKSLWGIELVNEPKMGRSYVALLRFYRRAYKALRAVLRPGVYTVFHDAFWPWLFSGALWPRRGYPVALDVHWYALFPRLFGRLSITGYLRLQKWYYGPLLRLISLSQPVIVGEWSSVLPQQIFNRTNKGSHIELLEQNITAQQQLYTSALAVMYWTYKADGMGMWNARSLVESKALEYNKEI